MEHARINESNVPYPLRVFVENDYIGFKKKLIGVAVSL